MPSADVVVPVYNAAPRLRSLLAALAEQSVPPGRIVLIDDGSSDGSAEVAELWSAEHPGAGVRVLRQPNQGPAVARNRGVRECTAEIILFTDSDCTPESHWTERMLEPFADPGVVGVQGAYRTSQRQWPARFAQIEIEERYERMQRGDTIDFIGTYSAAYRRSVFLEEGGFDTRFPMASGEDVDFSFRLADRGLRMVFHPRAVVYHRHPDTLARYLRQKYWRAYWRNLIYRRHARRIVRDSYTPQSLKIETLLGILFPFTLPSLFLPFPWTLLPLLIVALVLVCSLPFAAWTAKRSAVLALLVPWVVLLRTAVLAAGTVHGVLGGLWTQRKFAATEPPAS